MRFEIKNHEYSSSNGKTSEKRYDDGPYSKDEKVLKKSVPSSRFVYQRVLRLDVYRKAEAALASGGRWLGSRAGFGGKRLRGCNAPMANQSED